MATLLNMFHADGTQGGTAFVSKEEEEKQNQEQIAAAERAAEKGEDNDEGKNMGVPQSTAHLAQAAQAQEHRAHDPERTSVIEQAYIEASHGNKGEKAMAKEKTKLLAEMRRMRTASRCFPMLLELGMKAEAAGDKVEEELSALSVVSALLAVVTFSLLLTVPAKMDLPENLAQKRAYGVITSTALMLNLASVVLTTLVKKSMNCLVDEGGISRQYIIRFSADLTEICTFLFSSGVVLMLASILMFVYFKFTPEDCYIMIAITAATTIVVCVTYLLPHRLMVASTRRQFDMKMCKLTGETYPDNPKRLWRRIWDQGLWAVMTGGTKNEVHDSEV